MIKFSRPTILMCPPDFYGIEYEINPWMNRSVPSDLERSKRQWNALHDLLVQLGADVRLMQPVAGLPDLVFTANAGLVCRNKVFLASFRHAARQGETPVDAEWFQSAGFETIAFPSGHNFEGAGDALFCGDTLYAGYLVRSDVSSMQWIGTQLNCRVIPLQLVDDHYYHLDTCFCPLNAETALYYPGAFDDYARRALSQIRSLIPVQADEAARFACNAVVVGHHVVMNQGCPQLESDLVKAGYVPHSTPLDEFLKAGGSAKCLTLRLDGEEAAVWP
ncbi:dimethylarginine dimethylaminohydrolase family protein [Schlesneria paludicola]|uniref:dimethylarginine dimethylaminohydrolase family protein n=1 Tax=Schlesneria paludicola TaxID=360056 RepID=UPI00029A6B51|nr:arginine deiminase-related protein [Schlesneria paludicola]